MVLDSTRLGYFRFDSTLQQNSRTASLTCSNDRPQDKVTLLALDLALAPVCLPACLCDSYC